MEACDQASRGRNSECDRAAQRILDYEGESVVPGAALPLPVYHGHAKASYEKRSNSLHEVLRITRRKIHEVFPIRSWLFSALVGSAKSRQQPQTR